MKRAFALGAVALLLGIGMTGCSETAKGVADDTTKDTKAVDQAATNAGAAVDKAATNAGAAVDKAATNAGAAVDKAAMNTKDAADKAATATVDATKDAAKNTSAALALTPKVKLAITNDAMLNNIKNTINVDSADNVVHLKGTVISNDMKKRAGEVAKKALTDANATDKLSNELTVEAH